MSIIRYYFNKWFFLFSNRKYFKDIIWEGGEPTYNGFKFEKNSSRYGHSKKHLSIYYDGAFIGYIIDRGWRLSIKLGVGVCDVTSFRERIKLIENIRIGYLKFYKITLDIKESEKIEKALNLERMKAFNLERIREKDKELRNKLREVI